MKSIAITGSSSGIGKATAKYFARQGWKVAATMRKPKKETELNQIENVSLYALDVTDETSIANAVEQILSDFGTVDVVLNNAGYGLMGVFEAASQEQIKRQFDTNVIGLLAVTKALLPQMREQKSGIILNVSSVGGKFTFPLGTLYHGTKFAIEGISEALHYELDAFGVKVKIIEPGAIETDFTSRSLDFMNDESIAEYQPTVKAVLGVFENIGSQASPARDCVEVIWTAVTDGADTLRYPAAGGAQEYLAGRAAADDATFFAGMKAQMGL